jgi:hypothetical protein
MLNEMQRSSKPEFVNLLGSPGIDSQPGGPVRQPSLTYRPARLHRLAESIPWHRFLGSLNVSKYGLCLGSVPRKLLFWLHSREQPSPKGLNNIKKSAVSRGVNTSKKTGQMSSKYGEIIKKLISVFGEKPPRGLPKPPPSHRVQIPRNLHVEKTRFQDADSESSRGIETRREKGRGEKNNANLNNSITK